MAKQPVPLKVDADLKEWLLTLPNKNKFMEDAIKDAKSKHELSRPFTSKKEYK